MEKGGEQNDKLHDKFRHTMVVNSELITFRGSHPGLPSWPGLGGARWFLGCNEVLDFGVEFFFSKQNSRGHVEGSPILAYISVIKYFKHLTYIYDLYVLL